MNGSLTIFQREFRSYLYSPVAYVLAFVFLILCGYFFQDSVRGLDRYTRDYPMYLEQAQQAQQTGARPPAPPNVDRTVITRTYGMMTFLLVFILPILTMRLFSEEYRSGTIELLWTSPVRTGEMLIGKFLAALALFGAILLLTFVFVGLLWLYTEPGARPDLGLVFTSYLGMILLGATFIGVGIFASSITENQIVAAVISFTILLILLVVGAASQYVGNYAASEFLRYLSLSGHMESFLHGVLAVRDIVYYVTFAGFMLFITNRVLESRRWRA